MTCYFRHLEQIFKRAGIQITQENKREVDMAIQSVIGARYKNCPATWREVEKRIAEDEDEFISEVKKELAKRPQ